MKGLGSSLFLFFKGNKSHILKKSTWILTRQSWQFSVLDDLERSPTQIERAGRGGGWGGHHTAPGCSPPKLLPLRVVNPAGGLIPEPDRYREALQ